MRSCANPSARGLRTTANIVDSHKNFPNCAFILSTLSHGNTVAVMTRASRRGLVKVDPRVPVVTGPEILARNDRVAATRLEYRLGAGLS